jgi:hypothetical protein
MSHCLVSEICSIRIALGRIRQLSGFRARRGAVDARSLTPRSSFRALIQAGCRGTRKTPCSVVVIEHSRSFIGDQERAATEAERVACDVFRSGILHVLLICAMNCVVSAQETGSQARPEIDLYVQLNPQIRIQLMSSFTGSFPADEWAANPTFFIETALKPILRPTIEGMTRSVSVC